MPTKILKNKTTIKEINLCIIVLLTLCLLIEGNGFGETTAKAKAASTGQNSDESAGVAYPDPVFPFGAVYYRKANGCPPPPVEDWERDHKSAVEVGHTALQHRFVKTAIEVSPGEYDWRDYDRLMDIAAENRLKIIIREISYETVPCLDNEDALASNERFHTALIKRYRNHPATMGYDLWNEFHEKECLCQATRAKYREWLKAKYGSLEALCKVWHIYNLNDWDSIDPPGGRHNFPVAFDWLEFRQDNMVEHFRRQVALFRRLDKKHLITGHAGRAPIELRLANKDIWRPSAALDVTGYTWVASRTGNELWRSFQAVDLTRSIARGKPFWHAEAQSGPLWMQREGPGRPREDGRVSYPKDVRLWKLTSMAGGATGLFDTRWRPLLDGPLFGAFGGFGMDGSVTPQAEMGGKVSKWANSHPAIWKSHPVKGDVGIVFVPESQIFAQVLHGEPSYYYKSVFGAYQAFFDSNIQADFVQIDHITEYPMVYLPYPIMLNQSSARNLVEYVKQGGVLVSEGNPAYWGDGATVGTVQPNLGLDKLFGARQNYVEFVPDLLEKLTLTVHGKQIGGRYYLQEYTPSTGRIAGTYDNGATAAVENNFGKGKTLLIGTFPGAAYHQHHSTETRKFFAGLLEWGGVAQRLRSSDGDIKARLHEGDGGKYLWVVNPTRETREVTIQLAEGEAGSHAVKDLWGGKPVTLNGNTIKVAVGDRDVAVIRLQ